MASEDKNLASMRGIGSKTDLRDVLKFQEDEEFSSVVSDKLVPAGVKTVGDLIRLDMNRCWELQLPYSMRLEATKQLLPPTIRRSNSVEEMLAIADLASVKRRLSGPKESKNDSHSQNKDDRHDNNINSDKEEEDNNNNNIKKKSNKNNTINNTNKEVPEIQVNKDEKKAEQLSAMNADDDEEASHRNPTASRNHSEDDNKEAETSTALDEHLVVAALSVQSIKPRHRRTKSSGVPVRILATSAPTLEKSKVTKIGQKKASPAPAPSRGHRRSRSTGKFGKGKSKRKQRRSRSPNTPSTLGLYLPVDGTLVAHADRPPSTQKSRRSRPIASSSQSSDTATSSSSELSATAASSSSEVDGSLTTRIKNRERTGEVRDIQWMLLSMAGGGIQLEGDEGKLVMKESSSKLSSVLCHSKGSETAHTRETQLFDKTWENSIKSRVPLVRSSSSTDSVRTRKPLFTRDAQAPRHIEWMDAEEPMVEHALPAEDIKLVSGDDFRHHFSDHYWGKPHASYFAKDRRLGTICISIRKVRIRYSNESAMLRSSLTPEAFLSIQSSLPQTRDLVGDSMDGDYNDAESYYVLVFSKLGKHRHVVTMSTRRWRLRMASEDENSPSSHVVMAAFASIKGFQIHSLKRVKHKREAFANDLRSYEVRQLVKGYKIGLIYCKPGQVDEEEMFANLHEESSQKYREFLEFLGDKVELHGWKGYAGGLDTKHKQNGEESVFTTVEDKLEMMFHVATLMPFDPKDPQQVTRKRHIGNDVVCLVFQDDSSTPFAPTTILTTFIHAFIVVRPTYLPGTRERAYRVGIICRDGVPSFGPPLPNEHIFPKTPAFRKWLLYKLINAERASLFSPAFAVRLSRTRRILLEELHRKYFNKHKN